MRKIIILVLFLGITSCGIFGGDFPMTAFIVKNTSEKPISFTASIIKHSQIMGAHEISNSFTVKPNDSIIVRQTYFSKDGENPQAWFKTFNIFPVEGIEMNDPNKAENWKKSVTKSQPVYVFTINK
ncbi:hypothetical protein KRX57_07975 [Weeksellaceae bacterium TAE3-ERU29]|nr:hypothetical protein [Weeksellaceae bacterium TAE3-ERU29]